MLIYFCNSFLFYNYRKSLEWARQTRFIGTEKTPILTVTGSRDSQAYTLHSLKKQLPIPITDKTGIWAVITNVLAAQSHFLIFLFFNTFFNTRLAILLKTWSTSILTKPVTIHEPTFARARAMSHHVLFLHVTSLFP